MRHWTSCILLCLLIATLSGCRSDAPPKFDFLCLGDGVGGADCVRSDGSHAYLLPSQIENFIIIDPTSFKNYSAWCYNVKPEDLPKVDGTKVDSIANAFNQTQSQPQPDYYGGGG
jgi:hypothetical protein